MSEIRKRQEHFLKAVLDKEVHEELMDSIIPIGNLEKIEVLNIYRGDYISRLKKSLINHYPVTFKILGDEQFSDYALEYIKKNRSLLPDLGQYGHQFMDMIKGKTSSHKIPYLYELSTFENYYLKCFNQEEHEILNPFQGIEEEDLGRVRISFVESFSLCSFEYPVFDIWEKEKGINDKGPQFLSFFKRDGDVCIEIFSKDQFSFLVSLKEGNSINESLDQICSISEEAISFVFQFLNESHVIQEVL